MVALISENQYFVSYYIFKIADDVITTKTK